MMDTATAAAEAAKVLLSLVAAFLLGGAVCTIALVRWWARHMNEPARARKMLHKFYLAQHDPLCPNRPEPGCCPCCGWSEEKAERARAEERREDPEF